MPKVPVYSTSGEQVGEMELSDEVFGEEINEAVIYEVALSQMANARVGTASTKTRGEVRGGGRKPWRQKGTGRARAGSIRSPLWKGGGVVFGPKPRDYSYRLPRKVRRLALRSALSSKVAEDNLIVLDSLKFEEPKTKKMLEILKTFDADKKTVVVTEKNNENAYKSARNIPGITHRSAENLSVLDIVTHEKLLMTKDAVVHLEEVLSNG
ncbi:MAG TPA: 50S ribosomal protein L4 [Peptococcaceae bacterium]|nr:MAG: 50S ribosomal protein L4 [Clostridia bacterium 41_269]HBT20970.1 50S ribosomal protein L4 [Peptococcaceae bacterium]